MVFNKNKGAFFFSLFSKMGACSFTHSHKQPSPTHTHKDPQTPELAALLSAEGQIGAVCPLNILISSLGKVIDSSDSWAPSSPLTREQPHRQKTHTHTAPSQQEGDEWAGVKGRNSKEGAKRGIYFIDWWGDTVWQEADKFWQKIGM